MAITSQIVHNLGETIVEKAQRNVGATRMVNGKKRRAVASDKLRKSLRYNIRMSRGIARMEFGADPALGIYPLVVEYGRGKGKKMPPPRVLMDWIKQKNIRPRDESGKILKSTPARIKGMAFTMARSIGKKGIPGIHYFRDAINDTLNGAEGNQYIEAIANETLRLEVGLYKTSTTRINIQL